MLGVYIYVCFKPVRDENIHNYIAQNKKCSILWSKCKTLLCSYQEKILENKIVLEKVCQNKTSPLGNLKFLFKKTCHLSVVLEPGCIQAWERLLVHKN